MLGTNVSISAQYQVMYNPEHPLLLEDVYIDPATINDKLNYHNGIDLTEDYGHVFIPPTMYKHDGRSRGLLISRCCDSSYSAMEARCPKCYYKFHKKDNIVEFEHVLFGECKHCGARSENFVFWGSGQLLQCNDDKYNEIYYMESYNIEEVQRNCRTYLKISNNQASSTPPKGQVKTTGKKFYYPGTEPASMRPGKVNGYLK